MLGLQHNCAAPLAENFLNKSFKAMKSLYEPPELVVKNGPTIELVQQLIHECFEVNDRNIAEKHVVSTKRSQVDAKIYILPISKQHAPFFAMRYP